MYLRSDINVIVSHVFGGNVQSDNRDNVSAITLLAGYLFNTQRGANISFRAPYSFKYGRQLIIYTSTWKSLEIDAPINDGGTCLLDVIDNTKTASGARKLRSYLRTLPGDKDIILSRQTHIGHLLTNHSLMAEIDAVLTRIPDVNRALSRLLAGRGTPRDLRNVTEFLLILDTIKNVGRKLDDGLSSKFIGINTHDALANKLQRALNDELPTFFRDGNVIRSGFDISLDNMRKLSNGGIETIAGLQA